MTDPKLLNWITKTNPKLLNWIPNPGKAQGLLLCFWFKVLRPSQKEWPPWPWAVPAPPKTRDLKLAFDVLLLKGQKAGGQRRPKQLKESVVDLIHDNLYFYCELQPLSMRPRSSLDPNSHYPFPLGRILVSPELPCELRHKPETFSGSGRRCPEFTTCLGAVIGICSQLYRFAIR